MVSEMMRVAANTAENAIALRSFTGSPVLDLKNRSYSQEAGFARLVLGFSGDARKIRCRRVGRCSMLIV
jgi:hypothetical protein